VFIEEVSQTMPFKAGIAPSQVAAGNIELSMDPPFLSCSTSMGSMLLMHPYQFKPNNAIDGRLVGCLKMMNLALKDLVSQSIGFQQLRIE